MYDSEHEFDELFARRFGIYDKVTHAALLKSHEVELKYLVEKPSRYPSILEELYKQNNRQIAEHTYEKRRDILVTYNLDTKDQLFLRNGLSARIRFNYNPYDNKAKPSKIDLTVKTLLSNTKKSYDGFERGEWEAILYDLNPDLQEIKNQNSDLGSNDKPIPDLVVNGNITPDMLFVESIGATWRTTYVAGHKTPNDDFIVIYEHTEDGNLFNTPLCLPPYTMFDYEAEAERKSILYAPKQYDIKRLETDLDTSLKTTDRLIKSVTGYESLNQNSKSARGRHAVQRFYDDIKEMAGDNATIFNNRTAFPAAHYALSLGITPKNVRIHQLNHQMRGLHGRIEKGVISTPQIQDPLRLRIVS